MNPYHILGVSKEAPYEDIRRAYRSMAQKHHPDKGGDPDLFDAVQQAHEVLKDPDRRKHYDATGHTGDNKHNTEGRLAELFNAIIDAGGEFDIIAECRNQIHRVQRQLAQKAQQLQADRRKFMSQKSRVVSRGETNLYESLLDTKLEGIGRNELKIQHEQESMAAMLAALEEYEDSAPRARAYVSTGNTGTTSSATMVFT